MGSVFSTPRMPAEDPALKKAREEEEARLLKSREDEEARKRDVERKQRANLLGSRSLQSEDVRGFGGFRSMGSTTKPSGSIRE